jgi:acyl-CoA thioester hydrolase
MNINWDYPSPFIQTVVATENDLDGLGHVNNGSYIRWCEAVAWQHSSTLGLIDKDYVALRRAMAIHHAEYDYIKACFSGDELQVATWITGCDNKLNMERRFQLVGEQGAVFRGVWRLICINLDSNKPVRIPKAFIEAYGPALISND